MRQESESDPEAVEVVGRGDGPGCAQGGKAHWSSSPGCAAGGQHVEEVAVAEVSGGCGVVGVGDPHRLGRSADVAVEERRGVAEDAGDLNRGVDGLGAAAAHVCLGALTDVLDAEAALAGS